MKRLLALIYILMLLTSCMKKTIADAMLESEQGSANATNAAIMSYEVNGELVQIKVDNPENQSIYFSRLVCHKKYVTSGSPYNRYLISGNDVQGGALLFNFYTDSLAAKHYVDKGIYGNTYFLTHISSITGKSIDAYAQYATDSMSFNITSYNNRRISGTFSGCLTPLISSTTTSNTYGTPGSILIKNGSFQNVPVFY